MDNKLRYFDELKHLRLLVGYSGGVDSSVLVDIMHSKNIKFDIAIVDYGIREQSKEEVKHAKQLAKQLKCKCYVHVAEKIYNNFESKARDIRYSFFEKLINNNGYNGLVLGHHLNDKIEWTMMQFTKGAGLSTLCGFDFKEQRSKFTIYRPLLDISKDAIYAYAEACKIKYFEDCTNTDETYKRNKYRNLASELVKYGESGIISSYKYLKEDKDALYSRIIEFGDYISHINAYGENNRNILYNIDLYFKHKKKYVLSKKQRDEIVRQKFNININNTVIVMDKSFNIYIFEKVNENNVKVPEDIRQKYKQFGVPLKMIKSLYVFEYVMGMNTNKILSHF